MNWMEKRSKKGCFKNLPDWLSHHSPLLSNPVLHYSPGRRRFAVVLVDLPATGRRATREALKPQLPNLELLRRACENRRENSSQQKRPSSWVRRKINRFQNKTRHRVFPSFSHLKQNQPDGVHNTDSPLAWDTRGGAFSGKAKGNAKSLDPGRIDRVRTLSRAPMFFFETPIE